MLHPGPALAHAIQDRLSPGAVGDVGGGEIDHQEPPICIDGDVALSADNLLAGVVSPGFSLRSLDRLAVDHASGGAGLASGALAIQHQRHVVDGWEQKAPRQFAEPAVDRLPGPEMDRQHPPAATGTHEIAHSVDHLPEINLSGTAATSRLGLLGDLGHPAAALFAPHPELESQTEPPRNPPTPDFPNGL